MFHKTVSLLTAVCFMLTILASTAPVRAADKSEEDDQDVGFVRTISGLGSEGWAILDVRTVEGTRIVLSKRVGESIDLEESNRFALFQGGTTYTRKIDLPLLRMGVSGFQSAEFMKKANGKPAIKIQYRSGPNIESRLVNLRGDNDLRRLREYVENFDAIVAGTYTIADSSTISPDAAYPAYTEDPMAFEERRPQFPVRTRMPGLLTLKDGTEIEGELVPVFENGQILIESDLAVQKVSVDDITEVKFLGERSSRAMEKAVKQGVGGAATGALAGAFAAWQANADVKETALWAAIVFGTFGFVTGLLTGAKSTRSSKAFVLGPVIDGKKRNR